MSLRIVCGDPDHDSRRTRKGWSKTLGILGDPSEPIEGDVVNDGMVCGACGTALELARADEVPTVDGLVALREEIEAAGTLDDLKRATLGYLDAYHAPTE